MLKDGVELPNEDIDGLSVTNCAEFGLDNGAVERLHESKNLAKRFYTDLEYHNWNNHIMEVERRLIEISEYLTPRGVIIDMEACLHAVYWHDANYPADPKEEGFTSKEQVAASLAQAHLVSLQVPELTIEKAIQAIASTQRGVNPVSNEDTLTTMADLSNVAGDLETFFRNTIRLAYEKIQLGAPLKDRLSEYLQCDHDYLLGFFQGPFVFSTNDGTVITFDNFTQRARENISLIETIPIELFREVLGAEKFRELPESWRVKAF